MKTLLLIATVLTLATGCSEQDAQETTSPQKADHAWEAQTDALEKAKNVEQVIMDGAERQREVLEEQSR